MARRLAGANGAASLEGALASPAATPGIALFDAYRRDRGLDDDARAGLLGEAMLALYLHVRIQDDVIDEPELFDRACSHLAEVFSAYSARAFAEALDGEPAFFVFRERVLERFAAAALWEIDRLRTGHAGADEEQRIGEKLLPMAIPLGALAFLAGRPGDAEALVTIAVPLATGLQVVNDLLNLPDDHLGGRPTPLLLRLYRSAALAPRSSVGEVRAALLGGDTIEHACGLAAAEFERAVTMASALGLTRLSALMAARARRLAELPGLVVGSCLGAAS